MFESRSLLLQVLDVSPVLNRPRPLLREIRSRRSASYPTVEILLLSGLALMLGACATTAPRYASFDDVPYGYQNERTFWAPKAGLHLHVAELNPKTESTDLPIVMLHPWGLNMTVWADVAPHFAKNRRILLVDLPGHGKSTKIYAKYPMRRLATAVIDAMDTAGIQRAVVMGNSLGGATSLATALLAPERVAAVVAVGAPGSGEIPEAMQRATRLYVQPKKVQHLDPGLWDIGYQIAERSDSPLAQRIRKDAIGVTHTKEWAAWCRITPLILQNVAAYSPPLEEIGVPVLVVAGTDDLIVFPGAQKTLAERLPNSTWAEIEGCGHLPEIECPDAFVPKVDSFLAALE